MMWDAWFRRRRWERRLDTEMRFHLEQQVRDSVRAGMTPEEARRKAMREFGAVGLAKDECRDQRPFLWIEQLVQDVQFALRSFRRNPGFALVSVLTLALAIGATTAVFAVVHAILLRNLPFPGSARMLIVSNRSTRTGDSIPFSRMSQFREWQQRASSFENVAAFNAFFAHSTYNLTGRGDPERLTGVEVSRSIFPMLGASALRGRVFRDGEDQPGAGPVVLLSFDFWRRRFGASDAIVGQTLNINDAPRTIAGVLPNDFPFTGTFIPGTDVDIYLPLIQEQRADRFGFYLKVIGLLKPGVRQAQATEEITSIHQGLYRNTPGAVFAQDTAFLADDVRGALNTPLWVLLGSVGLVLLTGCANLANLFLARAAARRREAALRSALGAHRNRLARQALTESLVLAAGGAIAGIGLAWILVRYLRGAAWLVMPRLPEVNIDPMVLAFATFLCVLTSVLCGIAPALEGARVDLVTSLKDGGRGAMAGVHAGRFRAMLVAAQVALSLVLLVGSGLLIRSLLQLLDQSPGFRPERVVAMRIDPSVRYGRGPKLTAFLDAVHERVRAIPGADATALAVNLPLDRNMTWDAAIAGDRRTDAPPAAAVRVISPGYFRTLGITLMSGRDYTSADTIGSPRVVVVNQTLARSIEHAGQKPLDASIRVAGNLHRVVGVVSDVKYQGLHKEAGPELYLSYAQTIWYPAVDIVVRSSLPSGAVVAAVRQAVAEVDRTQAVGRLVSLEDLVEKSLSPRKFFTWLLGAFSGFSLLLACTGVYGVVSYGVTRRTREIGVRMALGARGSQICGLVLVDSMKMALLGAALGLVGSLAATRLLSGQLYRLTPTDPATFLLMTLVLLAAVAAAALIPAFRATRTDARSALLSH